MGQGSQVAAGAKGTLLRNNGMDAFVEHIQHGLDSAQADAGVPPGQGVAAQQHGGADYLCGQGLAHGAGMADNQIPLEGGGLVLGDKGIGEFSEAGGEAVDHRLFRQLFVHIGAGFIDSLFGFRRQLHALAVPGGGDDLFQGKALSVNCNHIVSPIIFGVPCMCKMVYCHYIIRR